MVACVAIRDAQAVVDALADARTLYVFGVIAARTSKVGMNRFSGTRTTPYVTPFGLVRETSLSREVVEAAAASLKRAGVVEVLVDDGGGYESWRCGCRTGHPRYATWEYSWINPPSRSRRRTRIREGGAGGGSGWSGAAWSSFR